jgi:anti-anti-sigma factor
VCSASRLNLRVIPERGRVRLTAAGEIDLSSCRLLDHQISELWDSGWTDVIVDLQGITFMDSTGVHLLLEHHHRARQSRSVLAILESPIVSWVLDLCNVRDILAQARRPPRWPHDERRMGQRRSVRAGGVMHRRLGDMLARRRMEAQARRLEHVVHALEQRRDWRQTHGHDVPKLLSDGIEEFKGQLAAVRRQLGDQGSVERPWSSIALPRANQ